MSCFVFGPCRISILKDEFKIGSGRMMNSFPRYSLLALHDNVPEDPVLNFQATRSNSIYPDKSTSNLYQNPANTLYSPFKV